MILIIKLLNFLFQKKIILKLKFVFSYENELTDPVYISNENFENCTDLLLTAIENKSHYVYIKYFNRFMCNKAKNSNKKHFCKCCLQCFSSEKALI